MSIEKKMSSQRFELTWNTTSGNNIFIPDYKTSFNK